MPSLHVTYKHSDLKQYLKALHRAAAGRALRTELTVNDTRDFAIGRGLRNLAALRQVGFQATRRLLDVQRLSCDATIGDVTVERVHRPVTVAGQRAPGLRFLDPRVLALFLGAGRLPSAAAGVHRPGAAAARGAVAGQGAA